MMPVRQQTIQQRAAGPTIRARLFQDNTMIMRHRIRLTVVSSCVAVDKQVGVGGVGWDCAALREVNGEESWQSEWR